MDIKAIMNNIRTKGFRQTWKIYQQRHSGNARGTVNRNKDVDKMRASKNAAERLLTTVLEWETAHKIDSNENEMEAYCKLDQLIEELLSIIQNNQIKKEIKEIVFQYIEDKEKTCGYRTYLKRKYIKELLPKAYDSMRNEPIEDKLLFMQPRAGLNQSCRYMFNTIKQQKKYEPVLYELDRDRSPLTLYYMNAVKWVKALATAKACFVHESNDLLGYLDIRPETKIVQLWHGCGIYKKIGLSTAGMKSFKSVKTYEEFPEYNKYDIVTIASPEMSWIFEEFMGIDKSEGIINPIGVSRTDEFFDADYIKNCYDKIHHIVPASTDKKIILYAPTYRGVDGAGDGRTAPDCLDIPQMAEALRDDYVLIIKHHQTVKVLPEIPEEYRDVFAYDMTRGKGMNINELMTVSDICISDYSSLVFEYALFERPMMFFAYDLENYVDERGMYYPYDELTPGPICKTTEEIVDYIKNIDQRFDQQEVIAFKEKFMCSCDGHSTQRILDYIENDGRTA